MKEFPENVYNCDIWKQLNLLTVFFWGRFRVLGNEKGDFFPLTCSVVAHDL